MQSPILRDFPNQFETERLLIRAPQPGDGRFINEAICESQASLKPWLPFADPLPTLDESGTNTRRAYANFILREDLRLHIFDKHTDRFLGSSGLHRMDWAAGRFEIGYWLRDSATGRGYMVEAVHGIVAFAAQHLDAKRIEIRCDSRNQRSCKVAERCGFVLEGVLRGNTVAVDGLPEDTHVYAKLKLADESWGYPRTRSEGTQPVGKQ